MGEDQGESPDLDMRGGFRLASPRVGLVLGVAVVVSMAAAIPLSALAGSGNGLFALALVPFAGVGAIIAWRQPWNPVGLVLLLLALVVTASSDAGSYSVMVYRRGDHLPLGRLAVFLAPGAWIWLVALLPLPLALFPDGRLSRGWRWVLWTYLACFCGFFLATAAWQNANGALAPHVQVDSSGQLASNDRSGTSTTAVVLILVYVGFGLAWLSRLVLAYRGSRGDYRQQLKWLLTSAAIGIAGLVLAVSTNGGHSFLALVGGIGFIVSLLALPIGLGVAILKYRLYEIDRLISRTISYLLVTGLLAGVFVGLVVFTTRVLPFSSPVGVAASTLAAAALFNPLRLRVQRLVDRRFNRARYDAEETVTAFRTRLREAVDPDTVQRELLRTVNRAVEPAHTTLSIRPSEPPRRQ